MLTLFAQCQKLLIEFANAIKDLSKSVEANTAVTQQQVNETGGVKAQLEAVIKKLDARDKRFDNIDNECRELREEKTEIKQLLTEIDKKLTEICESN